MLLIVGNAATADGLVRVADVPDSQDVGTVEALAAPATFWMPGGSAAAVAIAAASFGPVRLWHPLPSPRSSEPARRLHAALDRAGVRHAMCPVASDAVPALVIDAPDRRFCWSAPPLDAEVTDLDGVLAGVEHIVFAPRWGPWSECFLDAARHRRIPVSFVGEVPAAAGESWAFAVADARQLAAAPQLRIEVGVGTRGTDGVTITTDGVSTAVPAVPVTVVDTTGAGDAFAGTFLGAALAGHPIRDAGRLAAEVASARCSHWGALPPPDHDGLRKRAMTAPTASTASTLTTRERALGALWGQACGDAFGMPNSFLRLPVWRTTMEPGPDNSPYHAGYPAGRITDDTEQAQSLSVAFEQSDGRLNHLLVAVELEAWFDRVGGDQSLAVGPSTKLALGQIKRGVSVEEAGRRGVTNGAPMRIAAVGVWAALHDYTFDQLLQDVHAACIPTHNTSVAIAGSAAVAAAVWSGIRGLEWNATVDTACRAADRGAELGSWIYAPSISARIRWACELAGSCSDEVEMVTALSDVIGMGEATAESVPAAFAAALFSRRDPARAISVAGNARGDTDTVAAMAGAIAGAFHGSGGIPEDWRTLIAKVNGLDVPAWVDSLMPSKTRPVTSL